MGPSNLVVKVRRAQRAAILDLRGDIDGFSEQALVAAYAEAERTDPASIVLNFEQVHYINSTGIALIVDLLAKTQASHRRLLAYGLSDHFVEIFEITRLADHVSILADEESAVEAPDQPRGQHQDDT